MPDQGPPSAAVLEALGFALYLRHDDRVLLLHGNPPDWLARLWPGGELPPVGEAPFLENFLIDAEGCWSAGGRLESGPWVERDPAGGEVHVEATALTAGGRACLLIERLGEAFESRVSILQKARETVIALQRLDTEIQKKEILVHCLAEDLSAGLGNIITALRLLELEESSPRTLQLLALGLRGAQEQGTLISKVLELFADELGGLYGRSGRAEVKSDLRRVLQLAVEDAAPLVAQKGVRLLTPGESIHPLKIFADEARLVRVMANLLRNALENTTPGGEITVCILDEPEAALLTIEHPGVEAGAQATRVNPSSLLSQEAFLRWHFCRIAVESCHGEIGFTARQGGGSFLWVRLPKGSAST